MDFSLLTIDFLDLMFLLSMKPTKRLYERAAIAFLGDVGTQSESWDHQRSQSVSWDHQGSKPKSTSMKSGPRFPWSSAPGRDNNSHR